MNKDEIDFLKFKYSNEGLNYNESKKRIAKVYKAEHFNKKPLPKLSFKEQFEIDIKASR